jgi:DNA-directed RNA polymerase II subunit RPB2
MSFDDLIVPTPIEKVTEPVSEENETIPGEIKLDSSGRLLKTYFTYKGIIKDIIDIFDNWIVFKLKKFIESKSLQLSESRVLYFENPIIKPPTYSVRRETFNLLPTIARIRKETYSGTLFCDLVIKKDGKEIDRENNVAIGKIPIMVGSKVCHLRGKTDEELIAMGECPNDPMGYFIISGIEYVLVTQEKLRVNKFIIFDKDLKGDVTCRMTIYRPFYGTNVNILFVSSKTSAICIHLECLKGLEVPVLKIYELFGVGPEEAKRMILRFTRKENRRKVSYTLQPTFLEYYRVQIKNLTKEKVLNELFPHMENLKTHLRLEMLSLMVSKYLEFLIGARKMDDRDHWANKRLESAGRLMEQLFVSIFNTLFLEDLKKNLEQKQIQSAKDIANTIQFSIITDGFKYAFKTKLWGVKNSKKAKESVVEQIKREGPISMYSQILKINTPTSQQTKQANIRMVQMSQLGFIDPIETPEGKKCGLVKHRAITCRFTIERDDTAIIKYILNFASIDDSEVYETSKDEKPKQKKSRRTTRTLDKPLKTNTNESIKEKEVTEEFYVTVNGKFICWISSLGEELYKYLLNLRRTYAIHPETSIVFDREDRGFYIYTTGSRPIWPLLIVNPETNKLFIEEKRDVDRNNFLELLRNGIVEYIDPWEQDYITIAQSLSDLENYVSELERLKRQVLNEKKQEAVEALKRHEKKKFTHCKIDPIAILGSSSSLMPLANHNQGPRLSYFCSMIKQALSQYHSNHRLRFDPTIKVLSWPARPLFEGQMSKILNLDRIPAGENVLCAFMAYTGYNQEDSLIFNKASIDEGKFMYTVYFRYYISTKDRGDFQERFGIVSDEDQTFLQRNLDNNGIIKLGTFVKAEDILVRKIRIYTKTQEREIIDLKVSKYHEGVVDLVIKCKNAENANCVYIKIRDVRKPEVGDKFASRYAQKATIGIILPREDMPFNEETGVIPDVIINPHCIISRMTMGKMLEMISSKTSLLTGEHINATSFRPFDYSVFQEILKQYGYNEYGLETMRSGFTGELIKTKIFVGPCYYQAMRHHVKDKIQMRSRGAIKALTHQPISGRSRGGGLRFGEYEKDNLISHGAANLLQERMLFSSDVFQTVFCTNCGEIAISRLGSEKNLCKLCTQKGVREVTFGTCAIPYAFKTLLHYIAVAGISLKFKFKKKKE